MRAPESLVTLLDYGIIQEVVRPLMSGKEAQVYVVVAGGVECVAKVYKEATQRTFKHRSDYTEGRRTRNTRDQRAISKRTQHGRKKDEDAWRSTEVDMIYRLRDAGVRVPEPLNFVEGVLVMELVQDAEGHAAPRLGDLDFSPAEAVEIYQQLIREVVRMLSAGVIHGDLSDFNVLMSADGPVLIDFPQAVDPAHNPSGQKLLLRDVDNLHRFLARFAPDEPIRPYGQEIWSLFQANRLQPDTELTGLYQGPQGKTDTQEVLALIEDASRDERMRRSRREGEPDDDDELDGPPAPSVRPPVPFRTVVDLAPAKAAPRPGKRPETRPADESRRPRRRGGRGGREGRDDAPARSEPGAASPRRDPRTRARAEGRGKAPAEARSGAQTGDAAKPDAARKRRRRGRGRSRARGAGHEKTDAGQPGAGAGGRSGGSGSQAGARGGGNRPAGSTSSNSGGQASGAAHPPREGSGASRPRRRRSRRSRNTNAPE